MKKSQIFIGLISLVEGIKCQNLKLYMFNGYCQVKNFHSQVDLTLYTIH